MAAAAAVMRRQSPRSSPSWHRKQASLLWANIYNATYRVTSCLIVAQNNYAEMRRDNREFIAMLADARLRKRVSKL